MIEPDHDQLSVRQQCDLLGLNRATLYYRPQREDEQVLTLMRGVDELHTAPITWGSRKIRDALCLQGYAVNRKRPTCTIHLARVSPAAEGRRREDPSTPISLPLVALAVAAVTVTSGTVSFVFPRGNVGDALLTCGCVVIHSVLERGFYADRTPSTGT